MDYPGGFQAEIAQMHPAGIRNIRFAAMAKRWEEQIYERFKHRPGQQNERFCVRAKLPKDCAEAYFWVRRTSNHEGLRSYGGKDPFYNPMSSLTTRTLISITLGLRSMTVVTLQIRSGELQLLQNPVFAHGVL